MPIFYQAGVVGILIGIMARDWTFGLAGISIMFLIGFIEAWLEGGFYISLNHLPVKPLKHGAKSADEWHKNNRKKGW